MLLLTNYSTKGLMKYTHEYVKNCNNQHFDFRQKKSNFV